MHQLEQLLEECGFEAIGAFDPGAMIVRQEVRDMCIANNCHLYDTSWYCPPAIGSLDHYRALFPTYDIGFVFQTIANMEDEFDYEAIAEASTLHHKKTGVLREKLKSLPDEIMLFSAGHCDLCDTCTYPDAPCIHPDDMCPSLEACGVVVSEVCALAQVPYYHGPKTIAFIGGVLYSKSSL